MIGRRSNHDPKGVVAALCGRNPEWWSDEMLCHGSMGFYEVIDGTRKDENTQGGQGDEEQIEISIVPLSYAIPDPWTAVIHNDM